MKCDMTKLMHRPLCLTVALLLAACGGGVGNPTPVVPGNNYTVGGRVTGLSGTVVLQNNHGDNLSVSSNVAFTFATPVASGSAYSVTVLTQPSGQTCSVANDTGTISAAAVTDVVVNCTSTIPATVSVTISPPGASVALGGTRTFTATVNGTANTAVTWSLRESSGCGEITQGGVYSAPASTATCHVVATSVADTSKQKVAIVTVGSAPQAAMTTASRTSGVAPLAVFFDAVDDVAATPNDWDGTPRPTYAWTSGVTQPVDMEGSQWTWDFGDSGAGTWSTTGLSRNTATGYTAAHVYETPGTYTVTLVVTDTAGTTNTYTQTITVSAFSGMTRYVAAGGTGDGTSASTPWGSLDTALTWLNGGSGRQVLLRRGDSFTASDGQKEFSVAGPNILGAYADGTSGHTSSDAKPIIRTSWSGNSGFNLGVFMVDSTATDWRFVDINMLQTNAQTYYSISPQLMQNTANLLLLRVDATGYGGIIWSDASVSDQMFVIGGTYTGISNCNAYLGGRRLAVIGNTFPINTATHNARIILAHKGVVSHNWMQSAGGRGHDLKIHGPGTVAGFYGYAGQPETRWVTVTDNILDGSANTVPWLVGVGSQSSGYQPEASPVSHMVWERNRFTVGNQGGPDLAIGEIEASNTVIRNNIFNLTPSPSAIAIHYAKFGYSALPNVDDVRIYNNTIYKGSGNTDISGFLWTDGTVSNERVRNNFYGATTSSLTGLITDASGNAVTGGAGWVADHNLLSTSPGFTNAPGGDFTLQLSPAVDAGVALPEVLMDFSGTPRPLGSGYDIGAYESH